MHMYKPSSELVIDRESKLNALNLEVLKALAAAIEAIAADTECRCVILTGAGSKAFVAGADIAEMQDLAEAQAREFSAQGHATLAALEALPVPVIAAVQGFALGGIVGTAVIDIVHLVADSTPLAYAIAFGLQAALFVAASALAASLSDTPVAAAEPTRERHARR